MTTQLQALQQALTEISTNVYNWERDAIRSVADKALATVSNASTSPVSVQPSTPSSRWVESGEPDPHDDRYDCERAALTLGKLTDDELANAAFMNYDIRPSFQDIVDGKAHMPIVYMTAVKDRIRWLSRSLEKALAPPLPVSAAMRPGSYSIFCAKPCPLCASASMSR